jgi:hypothetical protein
MNRAVLVLCCAGLLAAATHHPTSAQGKGDWSFQRVGTFADYRNATIDGLTVSEIIAATADGKTLVLFRNLGYPAEQVNGCHSRGSRLRRTSTPDGRAPSRVQFA